MEQKKYNYVSSEGKPKGIWKLTYTTINRQGIEGFSGRMITSYRDPVTQTERHLYNAQGEKLIGYFLEKIVVTLNPQESLDEALLVDWLLGNPSVAIEKHQVKLNTKYLQKKEENSQIKLVNLDYEAIEDLEEEDYIDQLVGLVSKDSGPEALTLEALRFILAYLRLKYRDAKYIDQKQIEKKKLRSILKGYIRTSKSNADNFKHVLDHMDKAKFAYELKEMLRLNILEINNGTYMFNDGPIASSEQSLVAHFKHNPDFYVLLTKELSERLRNERPE